MRWSVALPLFAALAVGSAGCRSDCRRIESELRAREEDVRTLKEEVDRIGSTNVALTHELAATRGDPGPDGLIHKPSEPYPMRSLVIGRQTGGRNDDAIGYDDGLIVIIEPHDCDDQVIKAPGELVIDVIETPREGESRPLWRYAITPDQLRCTWQSGLFSTGYRLSLPFKRWPTSERLRVVAHFRMMNGRVFEAGKDVVVRLAPANARRPAPAGPTPPAELLPKPDLVPETKPAPEGILPPPTPVPDPPSPAPPPAPEKKSAPEVDAGPILTRVKGKAPAGVEVFHPVPLRDD
jgi:hypothetical protein